ncbi:unnamed protein product [Symbiodinium sp. CCMP2592]|nr:unnamed protein product [Symbiodinium sp. CCMP2592]
MALDAAAAVVSLRSLLSQCGLDVPSDLSKVHKVLRRLMQQGKIRAREGRRWEWAADDAELPTVQQLLQQELGRCPVSNSALPLQAFTAKTDDGRETAVKSRSTKGMEASERPDRGTLKRKRAPASGYLLFVNEHFAKVRREQGGQNSPGGVVPSNFSEIAKDAAARWRALPRHEQAEYCSRAAAARAASERAEESPGRGPAPKPTGRHASANAPMLSVKRKWLEHQLLRADEKLKQQWEALSADEVTSQLLAWRVRPLSGTDEFKQRLGSTLDELICKRMADLPFAGDVESRSLLAELGFAKAHLPHPAAIFLEWEAPACCTEQTEEAAIQGLRRFRSMPPVQTAAWWSVVASRARRQQEALRNVLCNDVGLVEAVHFKEADFERSGFDAFRDAQVKRGTEPLTLPGLQIVDPLWELVQEEEFLSLEQARAWSQKRYSHPRDKDSPAQLQLRQALREYNTRYAFDPEQGQKGGVGNIDEEIERYRKYADMLRTQIVDSVTFMHQDIVQGCKVLVEGANAALLDIDFGTYPFVTSSNTTVGSVCTGLGVPPKAVDTVIGVVKAYTTRVGHGPFPTELQNEMQSLEDYTETYIGPDARYERKGHAGGPFDLKSGQPVKVGMMLQEVGAEYGTTTGRRRRCGWLDLALVKYSAMVNGFDSLNITKLDVLTGLKQIRVAIAYRNRRMTEVRLPSGYFPSHLDDLKEVVCEYETLQGWSEDISKCTRWEDLPENAKKYVLRIQELLGIPVSWVGVGPDRSSMLKLPMKKRIMLPVLP